MSISKIDLKRMIAEGVVAALQARDQQQPKETSVEHATHCPNCYKDIIETMNENSEYVCADCHLPLGSQEFVDKLEKCPNCGGKNPEKVR